MSRVDRAVRRGLRHLENDEALLASAAGIEADGRRGRVVLVTDRRVVVTWHRSTPPDTFQVAGSSASFDPNGRLLTVGTDDTSVVLRDVDPDDARPVIDLLARRRDQPLAERIGDPFHVRIVSG